MSNKNRTGLPAIRAVREYFSNIEPYHTATADGLLRHLEKNHLIIVQRPARRGNTKLPSLGPLLGKSHTASLTGGAR